MENPKMPMLFPYDPDDFWKQLREIIKEEVKQFETAGVNKYETPGLHYKPLYKIDEICDMFRVSKPTIYAWIKDGKLKPFKIRSRVFFLHNDIQQLLQSAKG
jgi:excisionase family DNA binding protein